MFYFPCNHIKFQTAVWHVFTLLDYVTIGVPVRGSSNRGNLVQLERTLSSLINQTSTYEKLHNTVLIILLNHLSEKEVNATVSMITRHFTFEVNLGYISIIQEPPSSLNHSNRNGFLVEPPADMGIAATGDSISIASREAALWRKLDSHIRAMAFAFPYVHYISENYLHIEDDVEVASHFIESIRDFVRRESRHGRAGWGLLEFSELDFVGKFMRSGDVIKMANFFGAFRSQRANASVEWLYRTFLQVISQRKRRLRKPTLFQRGGGNGDDAVADEETRDRFFDGGLKPWHSDDPPATIITNMDHVEDHIASFVYASGSGYFQAAAPVEHDWIAIIFDFDVTLDRVKLQTGLSSGGKEIFGRLSLVAGVLEASPRLLRMDVGRKLIRCADFIKIADVSNGLAEVDDLKRLLWGRPTRCLRLTVTAADGNDVVFGQIAVYTQSDG